MLALKNLLVPVDFSPPCFRATESALQLARQFHARLHLLHVIEDPVVYLPMYESYPVPTRVQFEEYAQTRLNSWIAEPLMRGLEVLTVFRHGAPALEIASYADEVRCDLVILGTHGRGLASRWFLGSVAERVMRTARVPVLAVHSGDRPWMENGTESIEPARGEPAATRRSGPPTPAASPRPPVDQPTPDDSTLQAALRPHPGD